MALTVNLKNLSLLLSLLMSLIMKLIMSEVLVKLTLPVEKKSLTAVYVTQRARKPSLSLAFREIPPE
jgi:hypothetical protein